jgi:thiosulfate/3-mercaptopyruvate sulfurtransferase
MNGSALIEAEYVSSILMYNNLRILDASWSLDGADMQAAFATEHIAGAQFFDLELISDKSSLLPHMAPTHDQFAKAVGDLGINAQDQVVIYDQMGLFSAARVWWLFKLMGHKEVKVLRGGLPGWKKSGLPVTDLVTIISPQIYKPDFQPHLVIDQSGVMQSIDQRVILDARSKPRFDGKSPEPRQGLRSGHIPSSHTLPYTELIRDGALKPVAELEAIFAVYDIGEQPVITTCGSGVTAAIISLALYETGRSSSLYDGSWAQWGMEGNDTPVETL